MVIGSQHFRSAQDIHAELRAGGEAVGLTTVYRHLTLLVENGQLHTIQTADGEALYRRCEIEQRHHHVVCRRCGRGAEVELGDLDEWAESAAQGLGFTDVTHNMEIFGLCSACGNGG
jgi:Fur family ferric uptake transcriptional regulator